MEKEPHPKNRLEELQEAISNAAPGIEREFKRTANDWLSCFGSKVFVVETYLSSPKVEALVSPDKYQQSLERMEALKKRLYELKIQYPEKENIPPQEIKDELLEALNVLKE